MSLNWKELNLIITELDLEGAFIEKVIQPNYDTLSWTTYKAGKTRTLLFVTSSGDCRFHETHFAVPKSDKPLRFGEFCKSRLVGSRIESVTQLGDNRIIHIETVREGVARSVYIRLWTGSANIIVTDKNGIVEDAMRRLPKRGEISGGLFKLSDISPISDSKPNKEYVVREYDTSKSFNEAIDTAYLSHGKELSMDALQEKASNYFDNKILRIETALLKLQEKESEYASAEELRAKGEEILSTYDGQDKTELEKAAGYFAQYKKAKSGFLTIRDEITKTADLLNKTKLEKEAMLREDNPLRLAKLLKKENEKQPSLSNLKKRAGLSFLKDGWLFIVGRDATENDTLLRKTVRGNDLWLHTRDVPGGYVFIKAKKGKSFPLDVMLDAGNLAVFYSKARNAGKADLFYTEVKYLRRAKGGPKGRVLPTQEKNLSIALDKGRLDALEECRV